MLHATLIDDKHAFHPDLRGLTATDDVDAYVIFIKHPFQFRDSSVYGKGTGMVRFGSLFRSVTNVFAYYDVALIDARTLKLIRASTAAVDPSYPAPSPSRVVDSSLWSDSAKDINANQMEKIHGVVTDLINASVKETLLRLDLTNMVIVDSWPLPTENAMGTSPP